MRRPNTPVRVHICATVVFTSPFLLDKRVRPYANIRDLVFTLPAKPILPEILHKNPFIKPNRNKHLKVQKYTYLSRLKNFLCFLKCMRRILTVK